MSHFQLLADPDNYAVEDCDLIADVQGREYWLALFARHIEHVLEAAIERYGRGARGRTERARKQFADDLERIREQPDCLPGGKLRIIDICKVREKALRDNHLDDPFQLIKRRENEAALAMYQNLVARLDEMDPADRCLDLAKCIVAGNIFDLGSDATMKYANDGMDFMKVLEELPPRPWLVDDYDALAPSLPIDEVAGWAKAVIFVDNAGADFILGVMPLARELVLSGVEVVLAANELPSLNDVTADETVVLVEQLANLDRHLADAIDTQMLEVVSSGCDLPLIDLSDVSDELNVAAEGAELVLLEGMGRGVESNYDAAFRCDVLRLASLKDEAIAKRYGGKLFDVICKYTPVPEQPE